jgi:UDP-N-acetylglucosamine acyltransferase
VGLNVIGLRRRGFSKDNLAALRLAFRLLFRDSGIFAERLEVARLRYADDVLVQEVLAFIASPERRREMCRPGRMTADDDDDA